MRNSKFRKIRNRGEIYLSLIILVQKLQYLKRDAFELNFKQIYS